MITKQNNTRVASIYVLLLITLLIPIAAGGCNSNTSGVKGEKYKKVSGIYGTIKVAGSTTMSNLVSLWCNGFSDIYHDTNCIVENFGSSKAPPNLVEGKIDIGTMSEPMSGKDIGDFSNVYGYEPVGIKVAIDMIAVLVNRNNPVSCITIGELDGIYSSTNLCDGSTVVSTWGELNLGGEWKNAPIRVYGRTSLSGTYDVFRKIALCNGSYKKGITEMASSRDIIDFVSKDVYSIGYGGAGYKTPGVKTVQVGKSEDSCYPPEREFAMSNKYPFTRYLYLYPRENPSENMNPLIKEFLKYILSKNGQEAVLEAGFTLLPATTIKEEKQRIGD